MLDLAQWQTYLQTLDYQPHFVTVSGAHLYGFDSPDSDVDLRGCHRLPLRAVVGLDTPRETFERSGYYEDVEVDLVSHDIGKYLRLLARNNGYVLEQVFSPLIVMGQEFLRELRPIAQRCITRFHYHHYRGFYATQRKLLDKQEQKKAKSLLYAYRVLLTGIHLLQTGEVEANLLRLREQFQLSFVDELIRSKTEETIAPAGLDWPFHRARLEELEEKLDRAFAESALPESRDRAAVDSFLVEKRLEK